MITSEKIKRRLWEGANELRGSMDASRYKDYMLGLMFYKFLSDKTLEKYKDLTRSKEQGSKLVQEYKEASLKYENLYKTIQTHLGYYVASEYLYQTWIEDINNGTFEVQKVTDSLNSFERTISQEETPSDFKGLFSSSTIDFSDTALGSNLNERSKNIQALILLFADLNMVSLQHGDVLGDAYEYLIGQFAMESGKKAGEFYTPKQVSEVMAQIVTKSSNIESIYDPTVGSGSLLLTVSKYLDEDNQKKLKYYGQEKNTATYNLTRMNLILHGVRPEKMTIKNGDTLGEDWPEEKSGQGIQFDAVVMNPPYSAKNWNKTALKVTDPRFMIAGVLPPNSKGDYAFLLHGLYHLRPEGTMAIVLPHGVLFRGGAEGEIRRALIEKNQIDTIIGLPSNLFTNTGIPVTVIILKKNRKLDEPVLIIDASKDFTKIGNQNALLDKDIAKIVDTYELKKEIEGYSALVSKKDIVNNEYNLNIPRYVASIKDEIDHDVDAHLYGGIPIQNIKDLRILNKFMKETLYSFFNEIRPNYITLNQDIEKIEEKLLNHNFVLTKKEQLNNEINDYLNKYFNMLINKEEENLKEKMLLEIKEILANYDFINKYDGYQIISEIWKEILSEDNEIIKEKDFYETAKELKPNIIIKGTGSNKREVQEGFKGILIPNELVLKHLYNEEQNTLEENKNKLAEIDSELDELVEQAKIEDTEEYDALFDSLNKNKEGEPTNSFKKTDLQSNLKEAEKNTIEYELLSKTIILIEERTKINKYINAKTKELKIKAEERIKKLTNEEIDKIIYDKWYGNIKNEINNLILNPIKKEIDILKTLHKRYKSTIDDIDKEISKLEEEFQNMLNELVVSND
ncbi:MAG: type I restriction-modification system subunit M [Bacilli bacterium]